MRELKFRAWDTRKKIMYSADEMGRDQLTLSPDGRGFINVSGVSTQMSTYLSHLLPMQYTGKSDRNGKEIYAGCVIKTENGNYPVEWCEKEACFKAQSGQIVVAPRNWYKYIVIGNIYENPELKKD